MKSLAISANKDRCRINTLLFNNVLLALLITAAMSQGGYAHLMAAQHGTLNFVGNGAFMVLSLPASAFGSIDRDGDGRLSTTEFSEGRPEITALIKKNVRLLDSAGARPLAGIMLATAASHEAPKSPAAQVIVMGRFALESAQKPMRFEITLFGKNKSEKSFQIRFSRKNKTERDVLTFTQDNPANRLFAKS